jgi:hypothetical protein
MSHPEADPCRLKDLFEYSGSIPGQHCQQFWLYPASKRFFGRKLPQNDRISKRLRRIQPLKIFVV